MPGGPGRIQAVKKSKVRPEQILQVLRKVEGGKPVGESYRKLGVTEATFYRWRKECAGLNVGALQELRALRDEHAKLRRVVANLVLDKSILKEALGEKC